MTHRFVQLVQSCIKLSLILLCVHATVRLMCS